MKSKHLSELAITTTSHGCGEKRVLLSKNETLSDLTQIAITKLKAGNCVESHSHTTMEECFIIRSGEIQITIEGIVILCKKDDYLHILAGESHSLKAITDCELLTIGCAL